MFTIERSGNKRYMGYKRYTAQYHKNVLGRICSPGSGIAWPRYALHRVPFQLCHVFIYYFSAISRECWEDLGKFWTCWWFISGTLSTSSNLKTSFSPQNWKKKKKNFVELKDSIHHGSWLNCYIFLCDCECSLVIPENKINLKSLLLSNRIIYKSKERCLKHCCGNGSKGL